MIKECYFQLVITLFAAMLNSALARSPEYDTVIKVESTFITSCALQSGSIIMGRDQLYRFRGAPHYKICPYFSNFAAIALLDNPTDENKVVVKKWMIWVLSHLNPDGSIYDYYVDSLSGGTEWPSTKAFRGENIPDFDSQDSYAATFLSLARKYAEVVPEDRDWLLAQSAGIERIADALYATVDDSVHFVSGDNNDGLTIAKKDYQVKYAMDNSEVNEGLRDLIWLSQNAINLSNPQLYEILLADNSTGFSNLWNSTDSSYYPFEGSAEADWETFYPDAACQLFPIWCGVIRSVSSRACDIYNKFNTMFPDWHLGVRYNAYPWTIICFTAAVMNDTSRVNSYLGYLMNTLAAGLHPENWYITEAAFVIRAAKMMKSVVGTHSNTTKAPRFFYLGQNYPNPFNPATTITYQIPASGQVSLNVYDTAGKCVRSLVNEEQSAGVHSISFNSAGLCSGVYFYQLRAGSLSASGKCVLLK